MREYSFVRIPLLRSRAGTTPASDYRDIIRERVGGGWEFVQAIPFESAADPHLELVFTREGQT